MSAIHLHDLSSEIVQRTYCGHVNVPMTDDPAQATCKTCLKTHRKVVRFAAALATAGYVKP
jgi:hypothetical protein